jgi:high affinity Mn2+ porin
MRPVWLMAMAAMAPVLGPATARSEPPEDWALHAQSTFITQYHPGFRSPFRGPNSLKPHEEARETFDLTL